MKIALFYRYLEHGGIERNIVNIANYLCDNGHTVFIILAELKGGLLCELNPEIKLRSFTTRNKLIQLWELKNIIKRDSIQIIYSASPILNTISIFARFFLKNRVSVVISEHTNTLLAFKNYKFSFYKISFILIPLFYRYADKIIAVSHGVASGLEKFALINKKKIDVINNPINLKMIQQQAEEKIYHPWIEDKSIPLIISVGRLVEAKNYSLLLKAINLVLKNREVRLIIVGEGTLRSDLENMISMLALEKNVILIGNKSNPAAWIKHSDLFVLSSKWEGFGNVLVEALTIGKTIVSTNCKYGPEEILNRGEYGYIVPEGDSHILAETILYALNNPLNSEIQMMRAQDYDLLKIMRLYEEMFNELS
jgi:glycosyltransferase involved in cell wall biosynthesis